MDITEELTEQAQSIGLYMRQNNRSLLSRAVHEHKSGVGNELLIKDIVLRWMWERSRESNSVYTLKQISDFLLNTQIGKSHLLDTYGSNWPDVVKIVRQSLRMTSGQASRLEKAWDASWRASWGKDWTIALRMATGTAESAGRGIVWKSSLESPHSAAREAVIANVARDLIPDKSFQLLVSNWSYVFPESHS